MLFVGGVMGDSLFFSRLPQKDREIMMANTLELKGILASLKIFSRRLPVMISKK